MANLIDDMLKNQVPKKSKHTGLKVFLAFVIILILLVGAGFAVFTYFKSQKKVTPKGDFINYLGKSNVANVLNLEKIDNFNTKFQSEDSKATTEISGDVSGLIDTGKVDLSDILVEVNSKTKPKEDKTFAKSIIKYQGNDIIDFDTLSFGNKIGVYSEKILIKYVGSKYSQLDRVINKFLNVDTNNNSNIDFDFGLLKNSKLVLPKISDEILKKYIDIINQKAPDTAFASKKITLERNSERINLTEYSMTLNESQMIELIDQLLQILENDDELLDMILGSIGDEEYSLELKENLKSRNRSLYQFII